MSIHDRRRLAMLVAVLVTAGCTASGPAPVEYRTRPAPVPVRPAAPVTPPAPVRPMPPTPVTVEPSVEVQAAPVPPSGVQVRPLEPPRPVGPPPRTEPLGVKRPYSEATLTAMRSGATPTAPAVTAEPAPTPAPAPAPAPPEAVSSNGFSWPAGGKVVQGFAAPRSMGIQIEGAPGDPVLAAADGRVIFSGPGPRGYGNLVIVKHDNDTLSVYAHNRSLIAKEGQLVKRGQKIAEIGDSGTNAPKLHFEIRKSGRPIDPIGLLPAR